MVDAGWELDTQGISHADLITLDAAAAALPDRHRPQDDPAPLRGARQLVLLPVWPLRHDGDRRRAHRRLRRLHHRGPRLGRPVQRPLPPPAPAGAGRHESRRPAQADRRQPHRRRRRRVPTEARSGRRSADELRVPRLRASASGRPAGRHHPALSGRSAAPASSPRSSRWRSRRWPSTSCARSLRWCR